MAASALMARLTRRWRKQSCTITEEDPTFKTVYLGNTVTQWAKGSGSVDKPLATLWRNYCQSTKPDIEMRVTIAVSGLKATTQEHGLTEYWSHRITYAFAHPSYPKMFCWVYRHEGRKMKPELRCHAVLCSCEAKAQLMQRYLTERLHQALVEFRKEKQLRQNARLSVVSVLYPSTPRRKVFLTNGGANYRPPLERSKSAPKLGSIEEDREGEEPLVPPPTVSRDPGVGSESDTADSDSDTASEHSSVSVPSDPTADSDCEIVLLEAAGPCRVYHVTAGSPGSPGSQRRLADDVRLQVRCRLSELDFGHEWSQPLDDIDDSASDESGYAEEVSRAGANA